MNTVTFDTLDYSKNLEKAGFTREQAEALASAQAKLIEDGVATKRDLKELELRLIHTLTLRMGAMIIATSAFLATIRYFG